MADFDPNAWYQITESRVNFSSSLQTSGMGVYMGAAGIKTPQFWQVFSLGDNEYAFRNKANGITHQLGVCYISNEIDASKTEPCVVPSDDSDSQKWTITPWGDGESYKIGNVGNGTDYIMDCHPGNPMFMSSNTQSNIRQPAQHWMFSSLEIINDGAYSTTISNPPPSSSSSSSSSSSPASNSATTTGSSSSSSSTGTAAAAAKGNSSSQSSHSGLSTGAAVGSGLGIGLLFLLGVAAALLFMRRRRQRRQHYPELAATATVPQDKKYQPDSNPRYEMPNHAPQYELAANMAELPSNEKGAATTDRGYRNQDAEAAPTKFNVEPSE